jgi:uncharacterized membrane protein (DUF4010 family)
MSERTFLYGLSEHVHWDILIENIFLYLAVATCFVAWPLLYNGPCTIVAFTNVYDVMCFAVTDEIVDASPSSALSEPRRCFNMKY